MKFSKYNEQTYLLPQTDVESDMSLIRGEKDFRFKVVPTTQNEFENLVFIKRIFRSECTKPENVYRGHFFS